MRALGGAALTVAVAAGGILVAWRITRGVEAWFVYSGAGDVLMWTVVATLILVVLGVGGAVVAGAWGLAARAYVVRLNSGEYLESVTRTLLPAPSPAARVELPAPAERAALPE